MCYYLINDDSWYDVDDGLSTVLQIFLLGTYYKQSEKVSLILSLINKTHLLTSAYHPYFISIMQCIRNKCVFITYN